MTDTGAFTVDVSDVSYREAGIAALMDEDPAAADAMVGLVVNGWQFMDSRRKARIICLAMTPEFRAWAHEHAQS